MVFVHRFHIREYVKKFHAERLYLYPLGHHRHVVPVISHNRDWMMKHLGSGHLRRVDQSYEPVDLTISENGGY